MYNTRDKITLITYTYTHICISICHHYIHVYNPKNVRLVYVNNITIYSTTIRVLLCSQCTQKLAPLSILFLACQIVQMERILSLLLLISFLHIYIGYCATEETLEMPTPPTSSSSTQHTYPYYLLLCYFIWCSRTIYHIDSTSHVH